MKVYHIIAKALGGVLLECEKFDETKAGKYIITEIGTIPVLKVFKKTQCFSPIPTSVLLINDVQDCEKIKEFEFVD